MLNEAKIHIELHPMNDITKILTSFNLPKWHQIWQHCRSLDASSHWSIRLSISIRFSIGHDSSQIRTGVSLLLISGSRKRAPSDIALVCRLMISLFIAANRILDGMIWNGSWCDFWHSRKMLPDDNRLFCWTKGWCIVCYCSGWIGFLMLAVV